MKLEFNIKGLVYDPDHRGNDRYYFRRKGQKKIRIHSAPNTEAFREEVRCAELGIPFSGDAPKPAIKPSIKAKPGSLKWLALEFLRRNRDSWSEAYGNTIEGVLTEICDSATLSANGTRNGDLTYAGMQLKHVAQLRDEKSALPNAANRRVKTISAMYNWAIGAGIATNNPADKCPKLKVKSEGFHTWTIDEIRKYQERHAPGTKADLALRIFLFTGFRKGDAAIFNRRHVYEAEGERRIRLTPNKTKGSSGVTVDIPLLGPLADAIDNLPKTQLTILQTEHDRPYTANGLGNAMRDWCDQAGLRHCSAHGLRKAGAVIAAESGATSQQLQAIFGWTTSAQADHYTRAASRKKLATDGAKLITLTEMKVRRS
ncbi:tyrosine-type recombinase/integrase [Devosia crocina]|uniref:tyrosine-type recombinase/integrase n=1 Tax=Devosia crocina TaxID=429728 RepID=UPI001113AA91|nr:tyrosine-type recombinase/integrase [Devosia crocina]